MEFRSQIIKRNQKKGRAFNQITLDDDYIVPDSKPDVTRIIHTSGKVAFEEPKVSNQSVWVKGRLDFAVLYRSDREEEKVEVLNGTIPFQEKMMLDEVEELDPVHLSWNIEDLTVNLINSRKISVRAVVDIEAESRELIQEEIPYAMEDQQGYQEKVVDREMLTLLESKKDVLRIRNEIALPNAKPNIYRLLWQCIQPMNMETELQDGKLRVTGDIQVGILYRSQEEEQVQWFESTVSVLGEISCGECHQADVFWAKLDPVTMELETRSDYDGEERLLGLEVVFDVDLQIWKETRIQVLEDVFSLDKNVMPSCQNTILEKLLVKNRAKLRLGEVMKLESGKEKILQICACDGTVTVDRAQINEQGVQVEGVLTIHILYVTPDDNFPVEQVKEVLPFEQLVEVPEITPDTQYDIDCGIDQISVNLLDSSECEIKAGISIRVLAMEQEQICRITDIVEEPLDMEALQALPGIAGYVVKEGESLWDIAKKYHTTLEELTETNDLAAKKMKAGTKLIIVKKVG